MKKILKAKNFNEINLLINNMEKTQPKIFHIHIDGQNDIPHDLEKYAIDEIGFYDRPFSGHPEGADHFEPSCQLTLKANTKEEFKIAWDKLESKIKEFPDFVGYVEGEFIPIDDYIPYTEYNDIPVPFYVVKRKLIHGEQFRQTEVHLTMDKNTSHPSLIKKLLDSGLYGGYIPKPNAEYIVFTMQGYIKDIVPLITSLKEFLIESGGADKCTIKEERAIAHILCNVDVNELPEIADIVTYFKQPNLVR